MITKRKERVRFLVPLILAMSLAASVLCGLPRLGARAENDERGVDTDKFGSFVSEQLVGQHKFYSYEYGSAYAYGDGNVTAYWGGRSWKADIAESKDSALTRAEALAKTDVLDITAVVGKAHDAGATAAVESLTGKTVAEIGALFKTRYATLKSARTPGVPSSGVKEWDGYVFQDFCLGDSSAAFNWGERGQNYFGLCYSIKTGEVYYIADEYAAEFEKLGGNKKTLLGEMLSDSGITLEVGNENWTLQLFDNGYIRDNDGAFEAVSGVTYDAASKKFVKQVTLTSEYGAKVGAALTVGGKSYQNFENGYSEYFLLGGDYVVRNYANRNIDAAGQVTFVDKSVYTAKILSANLGENDSQKATILATTEKTETEVRAMFASAMERAAQAGFGLGVPCSPIKIWNNIIMMDFKLGDGKFAFGGDRVNMSFIAYNPTAKQTYAVSNYSVEWVNNELFPYGLPQSEIRSNGSFKLGGGNVEYAYMQEFQSGILYTTKDGLPIGELGVRYDEASDSYVADIAPTVPKQYGTELDRKTVGRVTYINYQKGCVTATRNAEGYCTYALHPGRNFDENNAPQLLELEKLIKKSDLSFDTAVDYGIAIEELRTKIYDEITRYYNAGYFIGFLEDRFKPWNDIDAQQFIWGDSTADPFKEEGRRHVAALALNKQTGNLCIMRDGVLDVWQDNYRVLGFPKANGVYYAEQGITVQEFDSGFIVTDGLQSYVKTGTRLENFLAEYDRYQVPTHGKDENKGYIAEGSQGITTSSAKKGCGSVVGGFASAAAGIALVSAAGAVMVRRRKV